MNKKQITLIVVIIFLIILIFAYFQIRESFDTKTKKIFISDFSNDISGSIDIKETNNNIQAANNIFFAVSNSRGQTTAYLYNLIDRKELFKKEINKKVANIGSVAGSNEGHEVQYNELNNDVYFFTFGKDDYYGECINEDGTCSNRLYRMSLSNPTSKPKIIFETDESIANWELFSENNSIYLFFYDDKGQKTTIKKLNANTGDLELAIELGINLISDFSPIISCDLNKVIQLIKDTDGAENVLKYISVGLSDGIVTEKELYRGKNIVNSTGRLSPNFKYVSFFVQDGEWLSEKWLKFYIYDLENNKLHDIQYGGTIDNVSLGWSGDSTKVAYNANGNLFYYNLASMKVELISIGASDLAWDKSGEYVAYSVIQKGLLYILDTFNNDIYSPSIINDETVIYHPSSIKGIKFYNN